MDSAIPVPPAQEPAAQPPVGQRYATGFASQDANGNGLPTSEARREEAPVPARPQQQEPRDEQPAFRPEPAPRAQPAPREQQAPRAEAPREQQAPRAEAPRAEAAPARGLPQVQRFELPVNELAQVAQGSGLQWVNSDAEKIAAVQAAIAAEPKPIHLPRERPPAVVIEEAPLVLVETKRDLREMKLPFEQSGTPPQQ
jgi:ribonuclease E